MVIPAVMFLEMVLDELKEPYDIKSLTSPNVGIANEIHEFQMLGDGRLDKIRAIFPELTDIERGYIMGLHVARLLLRGMPAAIAAKVEL